MKHPKQIFSLLLCLALALSLLLPGASAETEGALLSYTDERSLTDDFGRSTMFISFGRSYLGTLYLPDGSMVNPNEFEVWVSGGSVRSLYFNGRYHFNVWLDGQRPGSRETFHAVRSSDGADFTMPVEVTVPDIGLYSAPERSNESYLDYFGYGSGILQATFRYSAEQHDVYLCTSFSIVGLMSCETLPARSGVEIGAVLLDEHTVYLSIPADTTGVYVANLQLYETVGPQYYSVTFSDSHALLAEGRGALFIACPDNREPGKYENWRSLSVTGEDAKPILPEQYPDLSIDGDDVGQVELTADSGLNWKIGYPGRSATVRISTQDGSDWREMVLASILPDSGFFDAPEKSPEHYLSASSYTGDYTETEGRTVYYFAQASASDLVFNEAWAEDSDAPISVELANGGECLKISLDGGMYGQDFGTGFSYRGVAYNRTWEGSASVFFREAHKHALVWVPAREATCDEPGWEGYWACTECGQKFEGPELPYAASESFTRASLAQYLVTMLGLTADGLENPFPDVTEDMPEYQAILICRKLGLVSGYADGTFRPNGTVTRAEVAVILWRALGEPAFPDGMDSLKDMSWHWAADYAAYCVWAGLMRTDEAGNFNPNRNTTVGDVNLYKLADGRTIRDWTGQLQHGQLGHDLVHFDAVEPGYDSDGCIDHYRCRRCGRYFVSTVNEWLVLSYREINRDEAILPSEAGSILQTQETEVAVTPGETDTVTVTLPLDNVTDRPFRGRVLAAVFLEGRFRGVDFVDVELSPGQTGEATLEIQVRSVLGLSERATVRVFLVDASLAPVTSPQDIPIPGLR